MDIIVNVIIGCVFALGLIRDNKYMLIEGFILSLEFYMPLTLKLWAIYHNIEFSRAHHLSSIQIKFHYKNVIDINLSEEFILGYNINLITSI